MKALAFSLIQAISFYPATKAVFILKTKKAEREKKNKRMEDKRAWLSFMWIPHFLQVENHFLL